MDGAAIVDKGGTNELGSTESDVVAQADRDGYRCVGETDATARLTAGAGPRLGLGCARLVAPLGIWMPPVK